MLAQRMSEMKRKGRLRGRKKSKLSVKVKGSADAVKSLLGRLAIAHAKEEAAERG